MTAQISDKYTFDGKSFEVIATTKEFGFIPENYGLNTVPMHTACWRGFICSYKINKKGLFLDKLDICVSETELPDIAGVKPEIKYSRDNFTEAVYEKMHMKLDYTGSIVLGRKFIDRYYIHMGFQRAWAYEIVIEFVFENGNLVKTIDHSETVAEIREQIASGKDFVNSDDLLMFVDDCFSLDAKIKAWWI